MSKRRRIYEIIGKAESKDVASSIYDVFMLLTIAISLVPLFFKKDNQTFRIIDKVTVTIFIIDYMLRWITADYKLKKKPVVAMILYPFTFMAIIDLVSILPSLSVINQVFKALRMIRALRVIRVFKVARYSKSFRIIGNVLRKSKEPLIAVCVLALGYIFISALIIYNVEPDSFGNFFDAVYWATVSLTTVGYGDIYPVSTLGRTITMISSRFGIAIVALPAGIITAGYMSEIGDKKDESEEDSE